MHQGQIDDVLTPGSRIERLGAAVERLFAQLDEFEVPVVLRISNAARASRIAWVASVLTRCGNGSLYPVLSLLLIATGQLASPVRFIVVAALNLLIAFTIYPLLKHALARTRPCDYDPALAHYGEPLDRYSCPSGHTMTAVAFSVTLLFAWPDGIVVAVPLCFAMGWSRIALGHHYPTDVILGGAIGVAVATPLSAVAW